jgi:predicted PurR-regulated permease PerM
MLPPIAVCNVGILNCTLNNLVFWARVLGLVGALMAVLLLLMTKIFLARFDETRWLAAAISGDN